MTQFLLFVMAILLVLIFWELSMIYTCLKRALRPHMKSVKRAEETGKLEVA